MDKEYRRDLFILVFSVLGIGVVICLMPGDPPAAEMALQWIKVNSAFAGECKP